MEQRIKGTTGLMALIGSPVGHSGSPAMYNFSFRYHNLDYAYMAFDIKEDQVPAALDAIRLFKMRGANVTMPCKNEVAKHMDELSPAARIIGAVNTIVNEDGKLVGHITDGIGFVRNLKEHGVDVKGKKMVVLGAGGAATAIQVQCALDGAESISIFNPKDPFFARAESTAEKLSKETPDCKVSVFDLADEAKLKEEVANADILVNATLAGMKPHEELTLIKDKSMFRPDLVVADVVYNPAETRMVKEAKEAGCKLAIGGKGMLLWQGAAAYKLYTGLEMPTAEYQKFQEEKRKQVIITQETKMKQKTNKMLIFTSLAAYFTYFIHGIGASILGQYKPEFAAAWGAKPLADGTLDVSMVVSVIAALGLGRLISLPFSGPLSDKYGRKLSGIIGVLCYVAYFFGMANSTSMAMGYAFAVIGGIANSFLDTCVSPTCMEIYVNNPSVANLFTKFSICLSQFLLPFLIGIVASANMSYKTIFIVAGIAILIDGILILILPFPAREKKVQAKVDKKKSGHKISPAAIAAILIGFTSSSTFMYG